MLKLFSQNMVNDEIQWYTLEKFPTKDIHDSCINGSLTVIWRDWDAIIKHVPKMIYVTSVNPEESKGPHLHLKRNSYFVCIEGKVEFIIKNENGKYLEIESSEESPVLVYVPKNIPSAHINLTKKISRVLTIADYAWRPNDDEMIDVSFDDYDWKKWKN